MAELRIALATCTLEELSRYVDARDPYAPRRELIFAAGALDNRPLRDELGSFEQSRWDEGRRAADPVYKNPYYRD